MSNHISNLFFDHVKEGVELPVIKVPEFITPEFRIEVEVLLGGLSDVDNGPDKNTKATPGNVTVTSFASHDGFEVPVRIFTPEGEGPFPIVMFYHGGGWCVHYEDGYDPLLTKLTAASGCLLVSIDYRLAPEHKFPTGLEDCYAALEWACKNAASFNGDHTKVAVMGDSSGGNLATVVGLMARDRKGPRIAKQILIYPVTDASDFDTLTYKRYGRGYILERQDMIHYAKNYIGHETDPKTAYISPLHADVAQMPSTLIVLAECDVLADGGLRYAGKLHDAGIAVNCSVYRGMPHGFIGGVYEESFEAIDEIGNALKDVFHLEK